MSEEVLVPVLGESISEATVSKWLKKEGDIVEADEAIIELETDKVNLEVPSPINGVLSKINYKDGETVEVGAVLGNISKEESQMSKKNVIKKIEPKKKENNVVNLEIKKELPVIFTESEEEPLILTKEVKEKKNSPLNNSNETLSPAVRKIVLENKIDLEKVRGSGKEGRILKGD